VPGARFRWFLYDSYAVHCEHGRFSSRLAAAPRFRFSVSSSARASQGFLHLMSKDNAGPRFLTLPCFSNITPPHAMCSSAAMRKQHNQYPPMLAFCAVHTLCPADTLHAPQCPGRLLLLHCQLYLLWCSSRLPLPQGAPPAPAPHLPATCGTCSHLLSLARLPQRAAPSVVRSSEITSHTRLCCAWIGVGAQAPPAAASPCNSSRRPCKGKPTSQPTPQRRPYLIAKSVLCLV
jgi:hypothetical protein